jgi:hypothetical protein
LYDLSQDPGEQQNVAGAHPGTVAALRAVYDAWYDDMKATRNFEPGWIHLGSPFENPVQLCRFQDQAHLGERPLGWPVRVERGGVYEFTLDRGGSTDAGTLHAAFQDNEMVRVLDDGERSALFTLPVGSGLLRVWMLRPGKPVDLATNNDTTGDVTVRFLG